VTARPFIGILLRLRFLCMTGFGIAAARGWSFRYRCLSG